MADSHVLRTESNTAHSSFGCKTNRESHSFGAPRPFPFRPNPGILVPGGWGWPISGVGSRVKGVTAFPPEVLPKTLFRLGGGSGFGFWLRCTPVL